MCVPFLHSRSLNTFFIYEFTSCLQSLTKKDHGWEHGDILELCLQKTSEQFLGIHSSCGDRSPTSTTSTTSLLQLLPLTDGSRAAGNAHGDLLRQVSISSRQCSVPQKSVPNIINVLQTHLRYSMLPTDASYEVLNHATCIGEILGTCEIGKKQDWNSQHGNFRNRDLFPTMHCAHTQWPPT